LVLPNHTKESLFSLALDFDFLPRGLRLALWLSIFRQKGLKLPLELQRKLTKREYDKVVHAMLDLQLTMALFKKRVCYRRICSYLDWKK
jgi:hypothetical protein